MVTAVSRKAEDVRVQIRKLHQASLKRGNYKKHSIELEEVWSPPYLTVKR
jgi:ribosome recycling factor